MSNDSRALDDFATRRVIYIIFPPGLSQDEKFAYVAGVRRQFRKRGL